MSSDVYTGGLGELGSVDSSIDPFQAAGRWWARAVLQANFDNGASDHRNRAAQLMALTGSLGQRNSVERTVGGFANALGDLSRRRDIRLIGVDYHPDEILVEAAELSGMPANSMLTFPWKSHTSISDGIVVAKLGYDGVTKQVWPPIE